MRAYLDVCMQKCVYGCINACQQVCLPEAAAAAVAAAVAVVVGSPTQVFLAAAAVGCHRQPPKRAAVKALVLLKEGLGGEVRV
jgi:hypothetical protein